MSKELIVSTGKHETRVAILEDDQLVEVFHEREKEYSLAGSIHKGRVTRVLPGMQSAFVDIGLERDAFLYVSDFFEDNEEYDAVVSTVEDKIFKLEKRPDAESRGIIEAVPVVIAESAGPLTALPVAPPQQQREGAGNRNAGHDRNPDNRGGGGDKGGDRGRGRRGRRRRGGREGGLPDSKFASAREADEANPETSAADEIAAPVVQQIPQQIPQHVPAPVQRYVQQTPQAVSTVRTFGNEDFMVLPGESLAKYSAADLTPVSIGEPEVEEPVVPPMPNDPEPEPEPIFAAVEEAAAIVEEPAPHAEPEPEEPLLEAAVPSEHPLAGLGETQSWASETVEEPVSKTHEQVELEDVDTSEIAEEGTEEDAADEVQPIDHEGPEPARIPTSLTATLREQGHRYPHRVSRRMRRKMRGGEGENREANGNRDGNVAAGAPQDEAAKVVDIAARAPELREERRPEQGQQQQQREPRPDRPDRGDRGGRERGGGRGDRSPRPERVVETAEATERAERPERERPPLPSISDLLKEGQEIIVQIAKEPLGQKGARITSHIALPGRFVVYMPTVDHAGVSRKIPSDDERQRLKKIVQLHRQGIPGGFICRTAAEGKTEEELKSDMHFLYNLWLDMRSKAEKKPAPVLLHHDLDLVQRILRDQLTASFKNIWVDGEELYESVLRFAQRFQPALIGRVKLYTRPNPIFDEFGITQELEKALRPKVWLKSGGYIVINQTEALVAIDINTGKYVGKSNRLEDTIVKINTDAIKEIVRQIRLRDLGGIIVVDFIDMDERRNRQKVMQSLEESMRADRAPYKILQFNDFGLVAITRKRVKQSLERTLCSPCPYCEGAGYVKSVNTVVSEILQEAQRVHKALADQQNNIVLRVNPEVARVLKSNQNQFLQEIEETLGKSVMIKGDPLLHQTKFDLA